MFYIYEKEGILYGTTKKINQEGFTFVESDEFGDDYSEKDIPFKTGAFDKGTAPYGCLCGATIKVIKGKVFYRNADNDGWIEKPTLWNNRTGEYLEDGKIKTFFVP